MNKLKFYGFDGESSIFRRCEGCGEIIRYLDIVAHDVDADEWWHEGCAPECNCRETYPQLQPPTINHGPGCHLRDAVQS